MKLIQTSHPNADSQKAFDSLVGMDGLKQQLLEGLILALSPDELTAWAARHHRRGLPLIDAQMNPSPLLLLTGDVGCGKTAIATSVGTPLAEALRKKVLVLETPSDIRGTGFVGELSSRITAVFDDAKKKIGGANCGLLIIDEGDDLATSRSQLQAHHEDRAGVNVLIKELDRIQREKVPLAVILLSNRKDALDAAVIRRASLALTVERPDESARRVLFAQLLKLDSNGPEVIDLAQRSARTPTPYSYSDIVNRIGKLAVMESWRADRPLDATAVSEAMKGVEPSPSVC